MDRQGNKYSASFMHKVLVEALTSGKTTDEVAALYNISPDLVEDWKEAFIKGEKSNELREVNLEIAEQDKTIKALREKLEEKKLEFDYLMKKTSRFNQ